MLQNAIGVIKNDALFLASASFCVPANVFFCMSRFSHNWAPFDFDDPYTILSHFCPCRLPKASPRNLQGPPRDLQGLTKAAQFPSPFPVPIAIPIAINGDGDRHSHRHSFSEISVSHPIAIPIPSPFPSPFPSPSAVAAVGRRHWINMSETKTTH